jgi:ribose transport system substrate-binding protein
MAEANLAQDYKGTDRPLPASAPKPQAGKSVWVIACALAAEGCAAPARAAQKAGTAIGWHVTVADGKGDPSAESAAIRTAIAAHANAVVLVAIDCAAVKDAVQAADQAGIATFGTFGLDCNDKYGGGGKQLFSGQLDFGPFGSFANFVENSLSKAMADYAIAKTGGKAVAIAMRENDTAVIRHIGDGFDREFSKCTTCKEYTVPFTFQDLLTGKLQGIVQAALTQHPDVNVVLGPYDASVIAGIAPAVIASGRKVLLIGNEGLTPNIAEIRKGKGQDAAFGAPATWAGYATIDELNRIFHKQPLVDEGIGIQAIDHSHNLPLTPAYEGNVSATGQPKVDVVAHYLRIWGVGH